MVLQNANSNPYLVNSHVQRDCSVVMRRFNLFGALPFVE